MGHMGKDNTVVALVHEGAMYLNEHFMKAEFQRSQLFSLKMGWISTPGEHSYILNTRKRARNIY